MPNLIAVFQTIRALYVRKTAGKFGSLASRHSGSLKVIEIDTDRSGNYDFLSVSHSNYEPISYRFEIVAYRYLSKNETFSLPLYLHPCLTFYGLEYCAIATDSEWRKKKIVQNQKNYFSEYGAVNLFDRPFLTLTIKYGRECDSGFG